MKYMLDTNIIIYAKNHRPESVLKRLTRQSPEDICVSAITMAELEFGVYKSSKPDQNQVALLAFLSGIEILPFDTAAAMEYGLIRHQLSKKGTIIGANDLLIAAHARAEKLILVTNNAKEFTRIPDLKIENWAAEGM